MVLIAAVPADRQKEKTQPVVDMWVPHWNEETTFQLRVLKLALVQVEVRDYDEEKKDEFEGPTCVPVSKLKNGYRCVQMYDNAGRELSGVKMLSSTSTMSIFTTTPQALVYQQRQQLVVLQ